MFDHWVCVLEDYFGHSCLYIMNVTGEAANQLLQVQLIHFE